MLFATRPQSEPELTHLLTRQPIIDRDASPTGFDQTCGPQDLKVLRGIGDRQRGFRRQRLNRAFPLRQHIEQFETMCVSQRFAHAGKLLVEQPFELSLLVEFHSSLLSSKRIYSID